MTVAIPKLLMKNHRATTVQVNVEEPVDFMGPSLLDGVQPSPESPQNPGRLASFSGPNRFWGCRCGVQALGRGAVMLPDSFLKGDHFPRQQQYSPQLLKMALNTHQQSQQVQYTHDDAAIHVCWDCNARFTRLEHLKRHITSLHITAPKSHQCEFCSKRFSRRFVLFLP